MDAMRRKIESWYFRERVPLFSLYDTIVENETKVASIILDVGAGRRPHTNRAIAMDVSESELKANISSAAKVVAAAEHLPFRKECIELLTCSSVLEHLISPKAFFSEAARVLKPGGRLVALFSSFRCYVISLKTLGPAFPRITETAIPQECGRFLQKQTCRLKIFI